MVKVEKKQIILDVLMLYCFLLSQNVSGIQIDLTRRQVGDLFSNPYAKNCDDDDNTFCLVTNSICFTSYPESSGKCCYCHCNVRKLTFDLKTSRCAPDEDYSQGTFKSVGFVGMPFQLTE